MNKTTLLITTLIVSHSCFAEGTVIPAEEQAAGFVALFNGTNLDGWKHKGNWKVEDGVITREGKGGSLVYSTKKVPAACDLRFDWKVAEGSNIGTDDFKGLRSFTTVSRSRSHRK